MRCKFTIDKLGYKCSLDALPGEKFCYWHIEVDEKDPSQDQIEELRRYDIRHAYLKRAKLEGKDLHEVNIQYANLEGANLRGVNLQGANLQWADLTGANLTGADLSVINQSTDLQNAILRNANLQGANLKEALLQKADLVNANLTGANLKWAKMHGAKLWYAKLIGANLYGVVVDEETRLDFADLTCANLYCSYLDRTKTLKLAKIFDKCDKEIYEIVGDCIKQNRFVKAFRQIFNRPYANLVVLDVNKIKIKDSSLERELYNRGLVKYLTKNIEDFSGITSSKDYPIIFFDKKSKCVVKIPGIDTTENLVYVSGLENYVDNCNECAFTYEESKNFIYDASHDVYNSIYNFYVSNGKIDEAFKVHYRRGEAYRKLLKERGIHNWLRSWIFDFLILKLLTGYGINLWRPFIGSLIFILIFDKKVQMNRYCNDRIYINIWVSFTGWRYIVTWLKYLQTLLVR